MNKRPVNLALTTLKFPPMAIVSILHRLSGLLLACLIPAVLFVLYMSLRSEESFMLVRGYLVHPVSKLLIWGCLSALIYHLFAGMRHMVMDFGVGESVGSAKFSAWLVIALAVIVCLAMGVWLW